MIHFTAHAGPLDLCMFSYIIICVIHVPIRSTPFTISKIKETSRMKLSKVGALLLGIWLILKGLMPLLHFSFSGSGTIMAILAIAAGVLILIER